MPPRSPAAANLLLVRAAGLLKNGRPAEAVAPLSELATLEPDNALVRHDLGLALLETGHLHEAADAFRRAAAINPRYTDAHFRLGLALEKLGDPKGAVVAFDRATELLPSHTEAWFRAGALVFTMGHREEAAGCFRRAASSGPKTSFGRLGAARALLAEERDAEAERVLRRLLALEPDNPMALDMLGNLLADQGRFADARGCFERAVERAPLMAGAYYDLVRCRPVTGADGDLIGRMRAALAVPGLDAAQRLRVHLALGKTADDLGDHALAMQQFEAADALRRQVAPFDSSAFDRQIDRIIARVTPALLARAASEAEAADKADAGDTPVCHTPVCHTPVCHTPVCDTPVLIVGMPRSGTTLVEQIISSHPGVAAGGELNFWNERGALWSRTGQEGTETAFLARAASDYLGLLRGIGPLAARVTDKMPFNFLWAGLVHLACPRATIVNCRRAPIDVALSVHQTHFNPGLAFPTGGAELVAYIRSYQRLSAHWRRVLPPDRYVEIDYETLTGSPEPATRRLIAACGLSWDDACLHPERNPRVVKTASKWQARQPIYRSAVERWRRYEPWLGPLRALLEPEQSI